MSAKMTILPPAELDEGFALLKDIVQLANNPQQIEDAHKKAREEAALTEEELAKYDEARKFIAKYDDLSAALDQKKEAIATYEAAHSAKVSEDNEKIRQEQEKLAQRAEELNAREAINVQGAEALRQGQLAFQSEREASERASREWLASAQADAEKVNADKLANEKEAERLASLDKQLKTRLQKVQLREQAADLQG